VTETVYALAVQHQPRWIPDEILLITTAKGKTQAKLSLLSSDNNWLGRLISDYGLPEIHFGTEQILTVSDENGKPLDDIRTPADNERVADFITETLRKLTEDEHTELHVSIAGGRKTMGYYLGYALSLFGRMQDRLSHVLVSAPFESSWNFFYPTPYENPISIRKNDDELVDAQTAEVTLAEIPFVRLREELPKGILLQQGKASFSETVRSLQQAYEPPRLVIDMAQQCIEAGGWRVEMRPAELAFYAMMARRCIEESEPVNAYTEELKTQYLDEYALLVGEHSGDYVQAEERLDSDDIKPWFDERLSRTRTNLRNVLGNRLAKVYKIKSLGGRSRTRYSLDLPPEAVAFVRNKLVTPHGKD